MTESDIKTFYEERKLAYWRGELSQDDKDKFESIPGWSWYPSNETMLLLCNLRKRLFSGRGRPSLHPGMTEDEKHEYKKGKARDYYYKKKADLEKLVQDKVTIGSDK